MSGFARVSSRIAIAALAASGIALMASAPAVGHTGQLFTVTGGEIPPTAARFAALNPANAAVVPLAGGPSTVGYAQGIEIADETGYAVLGELQGIPQVVSWNHETGQAGTAVATSTELESIVNDLWALDTSPSGALLAFADLTFAGDPAVDETWIVEVDPVSGLLTPVVDLTEFAEEEDEVYFDSIATNPVTGETYFFFDYDDGDAWTSLVDLAAGTFAEPFWLEGVQDSLGNGWVSGADFDTAGTLWFLYPPQSGGVDLASLTGPLDTNTGAVSSGTLGGLDTLNLTYDPYVAPQLAATGADATPVLIGAAALLGAGALAFASRRRTA